MWRSMKQWALGDEAKRLAVGTVLSHRQVEDLIPKGIPFAVVSFALSPRLAMSSPSNLVAIGGKDKKETEWQNEQR